MKRTWKTLLIIIAWFQAISTLIGWATLVFIPHIYAPALDPTLFAGQYLLASFLLGVVVGGWQWAAIIVGWKWPQRFALAHLAAGFVMVCWIFGECWVLNGFGWAHALWGGVGLLQVTFVAAYLGVLNPEKVPATA
ncbi:hypothetical protein ACXZ66_06630 [Corynebacterium sp. S7]